MMKIPSDLPFLALDPRTSHPTHKQIPTLNLLQHRIPTHKPNCESPKAFLLGNLALDQELAKATMEV